MQTNLNPTPNNEIKDYLRLAETGFYPLFYKEWLIDSFNQNQNLNFKKASHNIKYVFTQLARHKTVEKKKTALIGMDKLSREEFIRSFFKVVEHGILKDIKKLQ
ncbi:MAG: hypothetical protein HON90_12895 [Halobacteriovoraceae bacterium]|jgi:hypothetical protein|nr:hypothetical protein [Halobacteriovoraceae bacterium]